MGAFLQQVLTRFHDTGAIAPSSMGLARALARPFSQRPEEPVEFLEAGPGTGALTRAILPLLRPDDRLILAEINPRFVEALQRRFDEDPAFAKHRAQVSIRAQPVQEVATPGRFAHVVCGLPFNNFDPDLARDVMTSLLSSVRSGGTLNFFEYILIRRLKAPFVNAAERQRLRAVGEIIGNAVRERQIACRAVLWNLPPAWARSLSADSSR